MVAVSQVITNEIDNIINVTDRTAAGAESAAKNMDDLQDKADATAQAFKDASDAMGGMASSASGSAADLRRGFDGSATSMLRMGASVDLVARKMIDLQRAQDRLAQVQAQATTAMAGGMSQEDADAIVAGYQARVDGLEKEVAAARKARSAVDELTDAHKLSSYQLGILVDEAHKFADQILAGGSAMTAAFYQAPNAIQTMGGLKNALGLVGTALAGPAGLAVGAGVAGIALYELGAHAEDEQSRLAKLSTQFRATREDAASMAGAVTSAAESLKNMPGWNAADARSAASTIGSTYNFTGSSADIVDLSSIARDAGTVFGSLEDGLKAVQQAMVDPTAEIEALYKQHLPGVDAALVEQVRNLQASGEQGKAYALVIGEIRDATKGAREQALTPFQRSLEDLHHVLDPVTNSIERFAAAVGTVLLNATTYVLSAIPGHSPAPTNGLAGSQVLDNFAGGQHHYGLGQVDPRYAYGFNIQTPQGNIDAALVNFMESNRRAGGNMDNALAYYSGNAIGSAGQRSYNSAVYGYDISALPSDTSNLINQEAYRMGLPADLVNVFRGVIGHESGGHQYRDYAATTAGTPESIAHATSASVISDQASLQGGASVDAGGYSAPSYSQQRAGIEAYITSEQKLLATQKEGSAAWQETSEKITSARVELANTLSPQEKITQGLTDSLDPLHAQTGYWRSMAEVVAQFGQTARGTGVDQQALAQALTARQQQLAAAYQDGTVAALRQAQSQSAIADAAGGSAVALQHATNYQQAYTEALNDFGSDKSDQFVQAVEKRTAALDASAASQMRAQQLQQNSGLSDNLEMIHAETASIGQNADQRSVSVAVMQAELAMHRKYGDVLPQEAKDYIALSGSVAQATADYQHQQQVLSDLTGSLSSMADTISGDITQALIQGAGAGVSFKSALQGIESQVVTMVAKLALIDPLLNSIDGGTRNTLGDIAGLLGGNASSSSSGSGSGFSIGQLFNMRQSAATSGNPFAGAGIDVNNTSEQVTAVGRRTASGYSTGQWAGGVMGGLAGGMSLGSMLGSVGGGIYGTYGSLAGTALGTGVGAIFGPMGSLIGGSVLGGLGGLIGGLFGHAKNPYTLDNVMVSSGQLSLGSVFNQAETDNVTSQLSTDIASINAVLAANGLTASGGSTYQGGNRLGYVGDDANNKDPSLRSLTLAQWLPDLHLNSSDATFQQALNQGMPSSFSSVSDFTSAIASLKTMADTVDSLHVSVSKFNSDATVTVGHIDGYSGDLSTAINALDGQTMDVSTLQQRISEISSTWQQLASGARSVHARDLAATGDQQGADLLNFDISADQQRADLVSSYKTIWGDAYATQSSYVQQSAALEKTLADERLQIQAEYNGTSIAQQKQYLSQAQQSVASVYSSLSSYAQGLALSSASPLSVQDQYNLAQGNLTSDYQAAQGGNYDALSRIQSDAQSFLGLSQSWQESGTGYAADYRQTLKMLQSLAGADTGALTAALAQKLTQNQVDATNGVTAAVADLKKTIQTEIQQLARVGVTR